MATLLTRGLQGRSLVTRGLGFADVAPPAANFLVALTDYLESHAPILALLDDEPRVHVERAGTNAVAPYVLVESVRLAPDPEGSEAGAEVATLEVNAYAPTASAARHLGAAIVAAIDPPALNAASTRDGRLEWSGGSEELALHVDGKLFRVPGGAFGLRANWAKTAAYEFHIRDDDGAQVTPDDPFVPDPDDLPETLPQAMERYLIASPALTALLGGAGKVYADLTTASGDTRPFVVVEGPEDDPDGEADEEEIVRLSVVAQARTLRVASAVHRLLRDLLDPPGMSRRGRRAAPFEWADGLEEAALWTGSTLSLEDGIGPGGVDVWAWTADYEFRTRVT